MIRFPLAAAVRRGAVLLPAVAAAAGLTMAPADGRAVEPGARVGVANAVQPVATGTWPDGATRRLDIGTDIVFRQQVATDASGRTQIGFLDRSGLTVGPSSQVTIDRFVYDPARDAGDASLSAATGVFRFVGGRLSKQGAVRVNTPVATIGIRGAIMLLVVAPDGTSTITLLHGDRLQVQARLGGAVTVRPGQTVVVRPGLPPEAPRPARTAAVRATLARLDGSGPGPTPQPLPPLRDLDCRADDDPRRILAPSDLLPDVLGPCDEGVRDGRPGDRPGDQPGGRPPWRDPRTVPPDVTVPDPPRPIDRALQVDRDDDGVPDIRDDVVDVDVDVDNDVDNDDIDNDDIDNDDIDNDDIDNDDDDRDNDNDGG